MDAAPPPAPPPAERLTEWERRALEKLRLLREGQKSGMLMVKFDGQVVTFWRILPDGRVE